MSEQFFDKTLSLFFNALMLLLMVFGDMTFLIFYFFTQNSFFYYFYVMALGFSALYGVRYYMTYRNFRETLDLWLPEPKTYAKDEFEHLTPGESEDRAIKCAKLYHNGCTFQEISDELKLGHKSQAVYEVRKGLHVLLKDYEKRKTA